MFISISLLLSASCGKTAAPEDSTTGWRPDLSCPGDADCLDTEGTLRAAASIADITPPCFESWVDVDESSSYSSSTDNFLDCGCDRLCPGDDDYPGPDEGEGDGSFRAVWLAGFGYSRPASAVHDPLEARALLLDQGSTRLALVTLDLVGWLYDDVLAVREALDPAWEIDHLVITSTHQHEGPDTVGIWGSSATSRGYQDDYAAFVRSQTLDAIEQAVTALEPVAGLKLASFDLSGHSPDKGTSNWVRDTRDPKIIDELVGVAQLTGETGETIASLVHWGNHPESMGSSNTLITSDFVGPLREGMEQGVSWDASSHQGLGGVSLFLNGSLGGMMTPLGVEHTDPDGVTWTEISFDRSRAIGESVASLAIDALTASDEVDTSPSLSLAVSELMLPVENWGYQAMFITGVLQRTLYDWDSDEAIDEDNIPSVMTEVNLLQLGELSMLTLPGEPLPELSIGGYDGSHLKTPLEQLVEEDNDSPPDLDAAPAGPYWRDRMPGEHRWILALANDELGYFIPEYNFVLDEQLPYLEEADGDHYEETNSLGPQTVPALEGVIGELTDWVTESG